MEKEKVPENVCNKTILVTGRRLEFGATFRALEQQLSRFTRKNKWSFLLECFTNEIEAFYGKISEENQNYLLTRPRAIAYVEHRQRQNRQIETERARLAFKTPDFNPIEMLWSVSDRKRASKSVYARVTLMEKIPRGMGQH